MTTMKYLVRLGVAAAIGMAAASAALATPIELTVTSGGPSTTILLPGVGSSVSYSNSNFNGWNISLAYGFSRSPSVALGALTLETDTTNCVAATCAPLTVAVSDIGYMAPVGPDGLMTILSNSQYGGASSVTQWAYMDTSNSYFGSTDSSAKDDFGGFFDPSNASLIGMLTVDNGNGEPTMDGGIASNGPYSLTLVDQFCSDPQDANGGCTSGLSFGANGGITSAPEPGGLALFAAGLLGFALFANRRRSSRAGV